MSASDLAACAIRTRAYVNTMRRTFFKLAAIAILSVVYLTRPISAGSPMFTDQFIDEPESRWSYVADTVMGGVSTGSASFEEEAGVHFVRLTGRVSTENNGGFIQVRTRLSDGFPDQTVGISLRARGNGETYYVFLRSRKGTRPWHSYRARFTAGDEWTIINLPLASFARSRDAIPDSIEATDVTGIGIVAYGSDFEADVSVAEISLY